MKPKGQPLHNLATIAKTAGLKPARARAILEAQGMEPGAGGGYAIKEALQAIIAYHETQTANAMNGEQFGRLCGLTATQVNQLYNRKILPRRADKLYEPLPCLRAYIEHLKRNSGDARQRLLEQQERKVRLQNDERAGLLIRLDDVLSAFNTLANVFRDVLMRKLVREAPPALARLRTTARIRDYLKRLTLETFAELLKAIPDAWKQNSEK